MNIKVIIKSFILFFFAVSSYSQSAEFASFSNGKLVLDNGVIHREIVVDDGTGRYVSTKLGLGDSDFNFLSEERTSHDFRFSVFEIPLL